MQICPYREIILTTLSFYPDFAVEYNELFFDGMIKRNLFRDVLKLSPVHAKLIHKANK